MEAFLQRFTGIVLGILSGFDRLGPAVAVALLAMNNADRLHLRESLMANDLLITP